MRIDSRRVVLGFYAGEGEYAQRAWRQIQPLAKRVYYFTSGGNPDSARALTQKYSRLRLDSEELIIAEVSSEKVAEVVGALRTLGEPGVFVVRPDRPEIAVSAP